MENSLLRGKTFILSLISFLMVAFGQPSFVPWLAPLAGAVGYTLFWKAIQKYPFRKARFWRATLWFALVSLTQLSWMSAIEYQGIYILFVWGALAIWLGLQFGFLAILIPFHHPLAWPRILAIASLWTLLEWSRFQILCGYSWNPVGLALSTPFSIQLATVFGVLGLSFWVIVVNLLGLRALRLKQIPQFAMWGCAALAPYLFGMAHTGYHTAQESKHQHQKELSCVLVQTGLLPSEKIPLQGKIQAFISPYDQWKRILMFLKQEEAKAPHLIVLPEVVVPFANDSYVYSERRVRQVFAEVFGEVDEHIYPHREPPFGEVHRPLVSNAFWVQAMANRFQSEVLAGLAHTDPQGRSFNSAFYVKPFAAGSQRYDKQILMPLAEYLPFAFLAPLVKSYGVDSFCTHGKKGEVFQGAIPLSVSICYEETFPEMVRQGRQQGAELLVNMTNDGWYPFSRLSKQHFELARLRAVENGAPLIRACNTGITAAIDSLGRVKGQLQEQNEQHQVYAGSLFAKFKLYDYPTLFVLWGNKGILTLSVLCLGLFLVLKREFSW